MPQTVSAPTELLRQCRDLPNLQQAVDKLLRQIPAGQVTTYGHLADALGNRVASRWVGRYLLHHEHRETCPCHRVVRADGALGGYVSGQTADKARLLSNEGVAVRDARAMGEVIRFTRFRSARPLEQLAGLQNRLRGEVSMRSPRRLPDLVGGVDVSYASPTMAVAAYALLDRQDRELVWSATVRRPVCFPYITSYLAFRELPILLDLVDEVRRAGKLADVILVDGSGILHPRRAGIASLLGVATGLRTVGVTKKLLCGTVDPTESSDGGRPVRDDGRLLGMALYPRTWSRKPLYVSPGHRTSVDFAARLTADLLADHKLPEPIYWADRLSRREAGRQ